MNTELVIEKRAHDLGGESIGERYLSWNYVSSSKERLAQAREDGDAQRMKLPVGDDREFMRLPDGLR